MAINKQEIEKNINEICPRSDIELCPHISLEKYLAKLEPKKAPNDPPALMTPKTLFASVVLK